MGRAAHSRASGGADPDGVRALRPLLTPLFVLAVVALAAGSSAHGNVAVPAFGVSDDKGKHADDGGSWFFGELRAVGLTANKMAINWDPSRPTEIAEQAFLDRSIPVAQPRGVRLSFSIHIGKAAAITSDPQNLERFSSWLRLLALRYPQVKEYVVGNEPNTTRFWQPQFNADGSGASGVAFARFLAAAYDTLKGVDPAITVVGVGLSSKGNDRPDAPSNISTSPVKFIRDLGIGYRQLGRDRPIMDVLAFHPYPARDTDSFERGLAWPNAGVANLDRIKQAVWDAFNGTAQPTFAEPALAQARPLLLKIGEVGWQTEVPEPHSSAYHGVENVEPASEAAQAEIYGKIVRTLACDGAVHSVHFFGLVDEPNLERWQAGLVRADGTRKPSWTAVQEAVADGCRVAQRPWRHVTKVVGATASRSKGRIVLRAEEDATVRVNGKTHHLRAYAPLSLRVPSKARVEFRAAMNSARRTVIAVRAGCERSCGSRPGT